MEELIVNKAKEMFFSYGLKSVSMDDLARRTGTSKKTIYQLVADKNELVDKVVENLINSHREKMAQCKTDARDAVEEVILKTRIPFVTLASINWNFFYELEKFFPAAWDKMILHRRQVMFPAVVRNLEWGMKEGHYRKELDIHFTANIRLQQVTTALNPKDFARQNMGTQKLMNGLTEFYLHAITSTTGKRLLNKYINGNNEN